MHLLSSDLTHLPMHADVQRRSLHALIGMRGSFERLRSKIYKEDAWRDSPTIAQCRFKDAEMRFARDLHPLMPLVGFLRNNYFRRRMPNQILVYV